MYVLKLIRHQSMQFLTLVVSAIQMCSVASVHPPTGALLLSTVALIVVIVAVEGAELHAVVGCEVLVAWVTIKLKAAESISGITTKEMSIRQTVLVGFWSNSDHVVIGVPGGHREDLCFWGCL